MKKNYSKKPSCYDIYIEGLDHYMDRELKAIGQEFRRKLDIMQKQYKAEFSGTVPTDKAAHDILVSEATAYLEAAKATMEAMETVVTNADKAYKSWSGPKFKKIS